jgi:GTPase SAR1 family protein
MTEARVSAQQPAQMVTTLVQLREALESARLPLQIPDVEIARKARAELLDQLEDYVLPRLIQIDAPLLTVVGGSTGAGKSTLVNSLVGERVTETGVLRPTTRSPVLVHNPEDADWFDMARILPDLERTTRASADPGALQLVASEAIPRGLAVLDAPDIDSVEEQNRTLAAQLLGAADLWLFVTSAARYADQVPWEFLKQAAERSAAVAIVLDRTAPTAITEVSTHLARMLTARGLRDSPLFVIPEGEVDEQGLLPSSTVREIRAWLGSLAADADAASCGAPSRVRSAPSPSGPTSSPTRPTTRSRFRACCGRRPRRPTAQPWTRLTWLRRTAPSFAARSWPAGRSSSAPASCSRRSSRK